MTRSIGLLGVAMLVCTAPARAASDAVVRGRAFAELVCSSCHAVSDKAAVPLLREPGPSFVQIAGRSSTTEMSLRDFLANDHPALGPAGRMPNPSLADYQIDEVVAYILSLRGPR